MPEDILAMYRELAERKSGQDDHSLLNELIEQTNIVISMNPIHKERATAFMECFCAAKMRLYDEGESKHLALIPLAYRFQLPMAVSNEAVRFVLDKPYDPSLNCVVACAAAVMACIIQPTAPKAGKEGNVFPVAQACKVGLL
jgi:hypothetical protein